MRVVLGLGKTGLSVVNYLARQGEDCVACDTRSNPPYLNQLKNTYPAIPIHLGPLDSKILDQAQEIIISPGIDPHTQLLEKYTPIGDIELFTRINKKPVVAVTGSNGKSTVCSLLHAMAKESNINAALGGNFGTPVLDLDPDSDLYILELSSFQLETTYSLNTVAASILNISPDHMDRYKSLEDYVAAKQRIFLNCAYSISNRDDKLTWPLLSKPKGLFSLDDWDQIGIKKINLLGEFNQLNIIAAFKLGEQCGFSKTAMIKAVENFHGLSHRCEKIGEYHQVVWVNDSKGTNIGATKSAIEGLGKNKTGKIILILGGQSKGADFSELQESIKKYIHKIIVFGQDKKIIEQDLIESVCIERVEDLKQAVITAKNNSGPKDMVLFSPACASFDMFENFEQRGEMFKKFVREINQ